MKNSEIQMLANALNSLTGAQFAENAEGIAARMTVARNLRKLKDELEVLNDARAGYLKQFKCVPTPSGSEGQEVVTREQPGGAEFIGAWALLINSKTEILEKLAKIPQSALKVEAIEPGHLSELVLLIS